jgi:uncharacterized protein
MLASVPPPGILCSACKYAIPEGKKTLPKQLSESDIDIQQALKSTRIAVVGMSANPARPSHSVAAYMLAHGYTIIPVNPGQRCILGLTCYPELAAIPHQIDMVNVFRESAAVPKIVTAAQSIGAQHLWLQLGVVHECATTKARSTGINVVMDRCLRTEHRRWLGTLR